MTSRNRRRTLWAKWSMGTVLTLPATSKLRVDMSSILKIARPSLGEYTITRIIGGVHIFAAEGFRTEWAAGIIQHPSTVTVLEIPGPLVEPHADWMWMLHEASPTTAEVPDNLYYPFDVSSQRKIAEMEGNFSMVFQNTSAVAVFVFTAGRTLIKL